MEWTDSESDDGEGKIEAVDYKLYEGGTNPDGSRHLEGEINVTGSTGSAAIGTPLVEKKFDIKGDDMKLSDLKDVAGFEGKIIGKDGKEKHYSGTGKE